MDERENKKKQKRQFEEFLCQEAQKHSEEVDYDRILENPELTDRLFKRVFGRGRTFLFTFNKFRKDIGNKYFQKEENTQGLKKKMLLAALHDPQFQRKIFKEITFQAGLLKSFEQVKRGHLISEVRSAIRSFVYERTGLMIAALVATVILFLPTPEPFEFSGQTIVLSIAGKRMLALLAGLVIMFITEALPIGATVGIVYAWIVFFDTLPGEKVASIFSHDAAWFLVGSLMIAQVLVKYGIHKRILVLIFKIMGSKTEYVSLGIIVFCSISSAFIAEHTIAALMLPIGLALIQLTKVEKIPNFSKLILFSIAYGCCIGGLGTPSGGGRNVVMLGFLDSMYGVRVGYGAWMIMALPIVFILIPCIWFILIKLYKPEVKNIQKVKERITKEISMSPMSLKEWAVIGIFLFILYLYVSRSHDGIGMISLFGTVIYLATGLIRWKDYQNINWGIPLLYFGAIGVGEALQKTGAATWAAAKLLMMISETVTLSGKMVVTMVGTLIMSAMSQLMSDGPCVATIGPVLLEMANLTGVDPVFFGMAGVISAAFAFMMIIGTPANAIVYSSGCLKPKDFLITGFLVYVVSLIVLWLVAYFWWGFLNVSITGFH